MKHAKVYNLLIFVLSILTGLTSSNALSFYNFNYNSQNISQDISQDNFQDNSQIDASHSSHHNAICTICDDEKDNFHELRCGHEFCRDCLTSHIDLKIREQSVVGLSCPERACARRLDEEDIFAMDFLGSIRQRNIINIMRQSRQFSDPDAWRSISRDLIDRNLIKPCPNCRVPIEKIAVVGI